MYTITLYRTFSHMRSMYVLYSFRHRITNLKDKLLSMKLRNELLQHSFKLSIVLRVNFQPDLSGARWGINSLQISITDTINCACKSCCPPVSAMVRKVSVVHYVEK